MAVNVIVCGALGRMGKMLAALAHENPQTAIVGATEVKNHPGLGHDAGEAAGIGTIGVPIVDDLGAVATSEAVILDFTSPQASLQHLRLAVEKRAGIVIGSTGFTPGQEAEARDLGARTRTVIAPNMSIGVNVLLGVVRDVASALGEAFDVEIVEIHHHHKKDAPSGTALALGRAAAEGLGRAFPEGTIYGRQGQVGERPRGEIGIMAVRAGDVAGDHSVLFGGTGERLELIHRAQSRECFAFGALRAALWLSDRPPGVYSMADVLGLD